MVSVFERVRWYLELVGYIAVGLFFLYAASHVLKDWRDDLMVDSDMEAVAKEQNCEYLGRVSGAEKVVLFNCKGKVVANLLGSKNEPR